MCFNVLHHPPARKKKTEQAGVSTLNGLKTSLGALEGKVGEVEQSMQDTAGLPFKMALIWKATAPFRWLG